MLSSCLLLAALSPALPSDSPRPAPSLRDLCVEATAVVLARPLDPEVPTRFKVLGVFRGELSADDRLVPAGLVERDLRGFDDPDEAGKKPRPRRIAQALLFLRPSRAGEKGTWAVLSTGFRLWTEDGRVLAPAAVLGGKNDKEPLKVAPGVGWTALLSRVRQDVAAVDQLYRLRRLGRPAERTRALLDWVEKRRGDFTATPVLRPGDLAPAGWGDLSLRVFDWIFTAGRLDDCWAAVRLYASLHRGETPQMADSPFASPEGRAFLVKKLRDDRLLSGDRLRAVQLLGQSTTLWPAGGTPVGSQERADLLDRLKDFSGDKDDELRVATVRTMMELARPAKGQPPQVSPTILNSLLATYRATPPGAFRDELARWLARLDTERYSVLSGNPSGLCATVIDLVREGGDLVFFLDLHSTRAAMFEQPTLVLERPGALGFIAEVKRLPLPVLNAPGPWANGVGSDGLLAVKVELSKLITAQFNPGNRTPPAAQVWHLRVEGSVGKGKDRRTWKSEVRRLRVRPSPANPNPYGGYMGKW